MSKETSPYFIQSGYLLLMWLSGGLALAVIQRPLFAGVLWLYSSALRYFSKRVRFGELRGDLRRVRDTIASKKGKYEKTEELYNLNFQLKDLGVRAPPMFDESHKIHVYWIPFLTALVVLSERRDLKGALSFAQRVAEERERITA